MSKKVVKITISTEEAGQKLLAFLQRNLKNASTGVPLPKSLLHRLIRSGQVRINSSRSNPFNTLQAGDEVRIPPLDGINIPGSNNPLQEKHENFAENTAAGKAKNKTECGCELGPDNFNTSFDLNFSLSACLKEKYPNLVILAENADYIVFNKPAGLPVHPGSRQPDSLISWVHACAPAGQTFLPTLAHRLDKATSGVLLIAKSYRFLRAVQDALAGNNGQETKKEYLAWVQGVWGEQNLPQKEFKELSVEASPRLTGEIAKQAIEELPQGLAQNRAQSLPQSLAQNWAQNRAQQWQLLEDWLEKRQGEKRSFMERVESVPMQNEQNLTSPNAPSPAYSSCRVKPIAHNKYATLMHIKLLTGRTHQIRVQLASRGHPIIGDRKYGGPACKQGMLLHSFHFCLANWPEQAKELSFQCLPNWQAPYELSSFISCIECNPKKVIIIDETLA